MKALHGRPLHFSQEKPDSDFDLSQSQCRLLFGFGSVSLIHFRHAWKEVTADDHWLKMEKHKTWIGIKDSFR